MATTLDQQFNVLYEKLQQLQRQQQRLKKENERLQAELQAARQQESLWQQRLDTTQQQVAVLKLTLGEMTEKDKKEFEKMLNGYIREIDKCIAILSQ